MTDESGWEVHKLPTVAGRNGYIGTARAVSPEAKSFTVHVSDSVKGDFDGTPEGFERVILEFLHDPHLQDAMKDLWYGENIVVEFMDDGFGDVDAQPAVFDEEE